MITVDNKKRYCDQTTLNFIPFPESISIGKETVLKVAIPHHFSSKLDFLNSDMRSLSIFQQTNFTDPHFGNKVINFFQTAETIHYSFTFIAFVCIVLLSILICCACYIKCPSCLLHAFCCCANTCCLKEKVRSREQQRLHWATEMEPMTSDVGCQPIIKPSQSPQPQPQVMQPSAPAFQPQQSQPLLSNCPQNILSCYCLTTRIPCVSNQTN